MSLINDNSSLSFNYKKNPSESIDQYFDRVVSHHKGKLAHNPERSKRDLINLLVQDNQLFNTLVKELPTLDIHVSGSGFHDSLFVKLNTQQHIPQLTKLVRQMFKLKELDTFKVNAAIDTLEDRLRSPHLPPEERTRLQKDLVKLKDLGDRVQKEETDSSIDENGICRSLIKTKVIENEEFLIKELKNRGHNPNLELSIKALMTNDDRTLIESIAQSSQEERERIIFLTNLNLKEPMTIHCREWTTVVNGDLFYNINELTILPGENLLDIALRKKNTDLLILLFHMIETSENNGMIDKLHQWQNSNPQFKGMAAANPILLTPLRLAAQTKNNALMENLLSYSETTRGVAFAQEQRNLLQNDPFAIIAREGEAIRRIRDAINPRRQIFGRNTSSTPSSSKIHSKGDTMKKRLVARHSIENKANRSALKQRVKKYIDAAIELAQAGNLDYANQEEIRKTEMSPNTSVSRFYLKNEKGTLDRYELIEKSRLIGEPVATVVIKNGTEKAILNGPIGPDTLRLFLKGDRLEIIQKYLHFEKGIHFQDEDWNEWSHGKEWAEYQNVIHPAISETVNILLENMPIGTQPTIVEICAGTGLLAKRIIDNSKTPLKYTLLEFNKPSVKQAKKLLNNQASVVQTDVVKDRFYEDEKKTRPIKPGSVDIIVGSGALTFSVLEDKESARKVLAKMYEALKPGGHVVLSGWASSIVDTDDFEKMGFTVINTYLPSNQNEFYILKKE